MDNENKKQMISLVFFDTGMNIECKFLYSSEYFPNNKTASDLVNNLSEAFKLFLLNNNLAVHSSKIIKQ